MKVDDEKLEREQPRENAHPRAEEKISKMDKTVLKKDRKSLRQLFDEDGNLS